MEADETFFNVSEKGSKKLNRTPKKRGESAKKRGISKDKVCVVVACNREQASYLQSACLGRLNRKSLDNVLGGKIEQDATLVVDGLTAYREFSKNHNIKLKQLKSGQRVSGKYHIQTVNQYHGGLKSFIRQFKGVATKYLDNYLTFFRVTKLVNNDVFNRMMSVNVRITNNELNNMKMELV